MWKVQQVPTTLYAWEICQPEDLHFSDKSSILKSILRFTVANKNSISRPGCEIFY